MHGGVEGFAAGTEAAQDCAGAVDYLEGIDRGRSPDLIASAGGGFAVGIDVQLNITITPIQYVLTRSGLLTRMSVALVVPMFRVVAVAVSTSGVRMLVLAAAVPLLQHWRSRLGCCWCQCWCCPGGNWGRWNCCRLPTASRAGIAGTGDNEAIVVERSAAALDTARHGNTDGSVLGRTSAAGTASTIDVDAVVEVGTGA